MNNDQGQSQSTRRLGRVVARDDGSEFGPTANSRCANYMTRGIELIQASGLSSLPLNTVCIIHAVSSRERSDLI